MTIKCKKDESLWDYKDYKKYVKIIMVIIIIILIVFVLFELIMGSKLFVLWKSIGHFQKLYVNNMRDILSLVD